VPRVRRAGGGLLLLYPVREPRPEEDTMSEVDALLAKVRAEVKRRENL
jgi:hypothetical protein